MKQMTCKVDDDEHKSLQALADRHGLTINGLLHCGLECFTALSHDCRQIIAQAYVDEYHTPTKIPDK